MELLDETLFSAIVTPGIPTNVSSSLLCLSLEKVKIQDATLLPSREDSRPDPFLLPPKVFLRKSHTSSMIRHHHPSPLVFELSKRSIHRNTVSQYYLDIKARPCSFRLSEDSNGRVRPDGLPQNSLQGVFVGSGSVSKSLWRRNVFSSSMRRSHNPCNLFGVTYSVHLRSIRKSRVGQHGGLAMIPTKKTRSSAVLFEFVLALSFPTRYPYRNPVTQSYKLLQQKNLKF